MYGDTKTAEDRLGKVNRFVKRKQVEFELNGDYFGRMLILQEMRDAGYEDEADDLQYSVCEFCLGTGEVEELSYDHDAHVYMPDGMVKCMCKLQECEE